MRLNTLSPAEGAKKTSKRVGRGIGSGKGKTAGRGHKGQKARSGGYHKIGFEGGQMPLQRRLPKFGFASRKAKVTAEVRLSALARLEDEVIDFETLQKSGLVGANIQHVKIIKDQAIEKAITLRGLAVSAGAKAAIESVGGKVE